MVTTPAMMPAMPQAMAMDRQFCAPEAKAEKKVSTSMAWHSSSNSFRLAALLPVAFFSIKRKT